MPKTSRRLPWFLLAAVVTLLCGGLCNPIRRLGAAKSFLTALSQPEATSATAVLREQVIEIPSAAGSIRARLYVPTKTHPRAGIVVAHGVHYQGIDERRLVPFARALAQSGLVVLTPELNDLADYRLTRGSVERIVAAVTDLSGRRDLVEKQKVGLLGFSFAGGLSLVAAADPRLTDKLEYVVSVGGHHDLDRVFRFLLTNEIETPTGKLPGKAHDYGLAVVMYDYLDEFVTEPELTPTRNAYRAWLHEDATTARDIAKTLDGVGAKMFQLLEQQKLGTVADGLRRAIEKHRAELSTLSPAGKLAQISVPIYLLHGAHDSVIPPSETTFASLELGSRQHQALVTPLIEHVEVNGQSSLRQKVELLTFMARLL